MSYPRFIKPRLLEACKDTPLLLLKGARQVGKSTLMQELISSFKGHALSFDDPNILTSAKTDPAGFISQLQTPVLLDEVQRAPEVILPLKLRVDKDRTPGQFLLTGSADFHTLPTIAESMAGRMEIRTLWPLSQGEINKKQETFLERAFQKNWPQHIPPLLKEELYSKILKGGYPEVLERNSAERRALWFDSYLEALIQKDIKAISAIEGIESIPNLLMLLASRSANLVNAADIARVLGLNQSSVKRYISLLQAVFIIYKLKPWFSNINTRLAKAPKVYFLDSGLLAHLLRLPLKVGPLPPPYFGQVLENFVVSEILKQCSWQEKKIDAFHFRTQSGIKVDLVLQNREGQLVGIEVKSSSTLSQKDFKGLLSFKEIAKDKFCSGILLYTGESIVPFGENLWAVPIQALWEST